MPPNILIWNEKENLVVEFSYFFFFDTNEKKFLLQKREEFSYFLIVD